MRERLLVVSFSAFDGFCK